jgi:hypothetical protein
MNSAVEIEKAILGLPVDEARAVSHWLQDYLAHGANGKTITPSAGVFAKWRGCGQLPAGRNTDDYLRLIRDGNGS